MKILFDHQIFAAQQWGGVSRYFSQLALELGRNNDILVQAPLHISRLLQPDRYMVFGKRVDPFKGATLLGNTLGKLIPAIGNFDIHHATWYGTTTPRRTGRLIHTVHDLIAELHPDEVLGAEKQIRLKAKSIQQADLILCVSETTRTDLQKIYGTPNDRIRVTPLATSLHKTPPAPFDTGCPYILHVGDRAGYKNYDTLLSAFISSNKLIKSHALVCFGGKPFSEPETKSISSLPKNGPGSVIHVKGNDQLLAGAYRAADLFVCPSRYEGFGLPVLEAMSMGCPVVAFRLGSIPEVAGNAVHYANEITVDALRSAMESILGDTFLRRAKIDAGRLRANCFSWENTAKLTLDAYAS